MIDRRVPRRRRRGFGRRPEQALLDPLTGLVNRSALIDRAQHALDRQTRHGAAVAIIFLDIDDFRAVNVGLGYRVGDQLLAATAQRLLATLRTSDSVGRTGGDDFAVVLEDIASPGEAYDVATRLLEALSAPFDIDGRSLAVSASVGVAVSSGGERADELMGQAGTALDRARDHGDGKYAVFESGMLAAARSRVALRADLRAALGQGQLAPWYQPVVALADNVTVGMEALVRWQHPQRGLILPDEFIGLAERTDLIVAIDAEILQQAAGDAARWRGSDRLPFGVSVNMAARTLEDPGLADGVLSALAGADLEPRQLTVEITEHTLVRDSGRAQSTLRDLRAAGVSVALDDFGSGHASFGYLERFPIDRLKIDRSFIARLADPDGRRLVGAMLTMARTLGLDAVAEGIETRQQLDTLIQLGCTTGQGYLLGRPVPLTDIAVPAVVPT